MKFKLIASDKLATFIDSIAKRGATLQQDIHKAAVSVIAHIQEHGDIMPARKLIEAVPAMGRKNALLAWFETFGPLTFDKDSKLLTYDKSKKESVSLDRAIATPFYEFKQEPEYKGLDFMAELVKLVARAEKAQKDSPDKNKDKIPKQVFLTVKELVQKAA